MLLPLFSPYVEQSEISNLPAYNFYAKLSAIHAQEPLSGQTLLLQDEGNGEVCVSAIEHSRVVFARKQEVEKEQKQTKSTETKDKVSKKRPKKQAASQKVQMIDD